MHIVCVCGLGMGSSLIMKMTVDKACKQLGIGDYTVEHWDAGTVGSKDADLIVTSQDFAEKFAGKENVIFVNNIVNVDEIKEKLHNYLGEKTK